jgi:hypothetical protein
MRRELRDGLYDVLPLYCAKLLAELPFNVAVSLLFSAPIVLLSGLQLTAYAVAMNMLIVFLTIYCSRAIALATTCAVPNFQSACFAANMIFTLFLLSAGYVVQLDSIWAPARLLFSKTSYIRYAFAALSLTEFDNSASRFRCDDVATQAACPIRTGEDALALYALEDSSLGFSLCFILGVTAFCHVVACTALSILRK